MGEMRLFFQPIKASRVVMNRRGTVGESERKKISSGGSRKIRISSTDEVKTVRWLSQQWRLMVQVLRQTTAVDAQVRRHLFRQGGEGGKGSRDGYIL